MTPLHCRISLFFYGQNDPIQCAPPHQVQHDHILPAHHLAHILYLHVHVECDDFGRVA